MTRYVKQLLAVLFFLGLAGCMSTMDQYEKSSPEQRVMNVQRGLVTLEYLDDNGADGVIGPKTREAIMKFQADNDITPSGELSYELSRAIGQKTAADKLSKLFVVTKVPEGQSNTKRSSDSRDPCDHAAWDQPFKNLADHFACDNGRIIAALSQGGQIIFDVDNIAFQNGKLVATDYQILTPVILAQARLRRKHNHQDFGYVTQNMDQSKFLCTFPGERAANIREGDTILVSAKLKNYSGRTGHLECDLN